jgi:hypothetical protein
LTVEPPRNGPSYDIFVPIGDPEGSSLTASGRARLVCSPCLRSTRCPWDNPDRRHALVPVPNEHPVVPDKKASAMPDQPSDQAARVPAGVLDRLITRALAIVPKPLKGLIGFVLGLFLLLALFGGAMFGLARLIKGMPK